MSMHVVAQLPQAMSSHDTGARQHRLHYNATASISAELTFRGVVPVAYYQHGPLEPPPPPQRYFKH